MNLKSDRPTARELQLLAEVESLRREIDSLKAENQDLRLTLMMTAEHGDTVEAYLTETNTKLQQEVKERQRIQATLQSVLQIISRQKDDLEIIVQTLIEHGDVVDAQWYAKVREANQLATVDSLTQLANRRKFDEYLNLQWQQMQAARSPLAIFLCDIDYFKQYNDTYGHLAGDDCLKQVAQVLQNSVQRSQDLVSRYGGEEFALILPDTTLEDAIEVASHIQTEIQQLKIPHLRSLACKNISLSIGIAVLTPHENSSAKALVDEADHLLYLAKQQGRNQIVYRQIAEDENLSLSRASSDRFLAKINTKIIDPV